MSHKNIVWILLVISLLLESVILSIAFSIDCWPTPEAGFSGLICGGFFETYIEPLFWSFLPLFVTSLLLLFVRRETFISWAKFAVPAFIAMLAIIFYTYNNEPIIGGWVSFGSDDQLATVLGPSLFFLISLIIITVKSYRLRRA